MPTTSDWFLDLFSSEAEKLIEEVFSTPLHRLRGELGEKNWWIPSLPLPAGDSVVVGAVDGGGGVQGVAGGGALYIARAYGYLSSGEEPERLLELRIYPARDVEILEALRSWVEARTALNLVLRVPRGSFILVDGSLWALVSKAVSSLYRAYRGLLSSSSKAYSLLFYSYTLASIADLVDEAAKKRVELVFVSKDHSYRFLKEKILLEELARRSPEAKTIASSMLEWYPATTPRPRALSLRKTLRAESRRLLDLALDPGYRDPWFIDDCVGEKKGYTLPLRIPPPERIGRLLSYTNPARIRDGVLEKIEGLVSDREYEELSSILKRLSNRLSSLPSSAGFYVRFSRLDQLLLVETPLREPSYHVSGRFFVGEAAAARIVSLLLRDYGGPYYYNTPLIMAHVNATLTSSQLEAYTRLFQALASSRGVDIEFSRRTILHEWSPKKRHQHS